MRIESTIHYAELAETSAGIRVTIFRRTARVDGPQMGNAWRLLHRDTLPAVDVLRAAEGVRAMLTALDGDTQ